MTEMKSSIDECDIFDFMANIVGMTVLHPSGFEATDKLAQLCHISSDTKVLDIACGKGTSAVYIAKKHSCEIEGVDVDENLIEQARDLTKRKRLERQVRFKVGDASKLPYHENEDRFPGSPSSDTRQKESDPGSIESDETRRICWLVGTQP